VRQDTAAAPESIEKGLVLAGLEALRGIGGEELVQVLLGVAGKPEFARAEGLPERIPVADYLQLRDTLLEFLQESFSATAFKMGQVLVRDLQHGKQAKEVGRLVEHFKFARNKLPVIGQAAVLASKGNPGSVSAAMRDDSVLVIVIQNCPECRGLRRDAPVCYVNQGVVTEFAKAFLGLEVKTEETRCMALGHPSCEIEVVAGP
jgi:predicted hydrocarbon binding protein